MHKGNLPLFLNNGQLVLNMYDFALLRFFVKNKQNKTEIRKEGKTAIFHLLLYLNKILTIVFQILYFCVNSSIEFDWFGCDSCSNMITKTSTSI